MSSPVGFDSDDPEMAAAISAAKETFAQFLEAFLDPKAGQSAFLLKAAFEYRDQLEHIWVADIEIEGESFRGVIANEPELPNYRFKQQVRFEPMYITDWMFIDNGKLVGGYTTRLIRQRMSDEERAAFDATLPGRID